MKIAKLFVLSFVLAITAHVYASDKHHGDANRGKVACSSETCCKAEPQCCKPGAKCCEDGAQCCKSKESCCAQHEQCCEGSAHCVIACTAGAKGECCAEEGSCSKAEKNCCGAACKKPASTSY
jgi:hypothetical protein